MARGSWDDFTHKYGFRDGDAIEERDFTARRHLVELLNASALFQDRGVRAVEYDRPGMHNACLIILLANPAGRSDAELLQEWGNNQLKEEPMSLVADLDPEHDIAYLIAEAYASADTPEGGAAAELRYIEEQDDLERRLEEAMPQQLRIDCQLLADYYGGDPWVEAVQLLELVNLALQRAPIGSQPQLLPVMDDEHLLVTVEADASDDEDLSQ